MTELAMPEAERDTIPFPVDHRRNGLAFFLDSAFFYIGATFISSTTVLPAFVAALGGSEVMVGLASGVISGAWLVPQLFVASAVAHLPRKKPVVVWGALLTRPVVLLAALLVWLLGAQRPSAALAAIVIGLVIFYLFDAVVSVPWFELLARGLPLRRRGWVLGAAQVLGSAGGIGAGVAVRYILSNTSPFPFPTNYALLFALGGVLFLISAAFLALIQEPPSTRPLDHEPPTPREVLASMPGLLNRDRAFLRLIAIKLVHGFIGVSSAFFVLNATRNLGIDVENTGLFASAQVIGSLAAGLLMGIVQDRWGPWVHIRLVIVVTALPSLVALLVQPFSGFLQPQMLYIYLLIFFLLGIATGSVGWPFFNWILEHAVEEERPVYIGLSNTLSAVVMLAPTLGGWVAKAASYPAVFGLALGFTLVAWLLTDRLPNPRLSRPTS